MGRYRKAKPSASEVALNRLKRRLMVAPSAGATASPLSLHAAGFHLSIEHDGDHEEDEEHQRHRRSERPVAVGKELAPELASDYQGLGTAEKIRDHEFSHRRDEAQQRPRDDAGHA